VSERTPGPWGRFDYRVFARRADGSPYLIAQTAFSVRDRTAEAEANAQFIADSENRISLLERLLACEVKNRDHAIALADKFERRLSDIHDHGGIRAESAPDADTCKVGATATTPPAGVCVATGVFDRRPYFGRVVVDGISCFKMPEDKARKLAGRKVRVWVEDLGESK
jgi:hypothetical protein